MGDNSDAFPVDATQWNDTDGDGHGDNKYGNQGDYLNDPTRWKDSDEDGIADEDDAFPNDPTNNTTETATATATTPAATTPTSSPTTLKRKTPTTTV